MAGAAWLEAGADKRDTAPVTSAPADNASAPRLSDIGRGIALRVASAGCFSIMSGLFKLSASDGVVAPEMLFYRAVFGLPVVLAWVIWSQGGVVSGLKTLTTRRPLAHLGRCVLGVCGILCIFQTLTLLPLADATTLSFTAPIFATLLSWLLLKETVGPHRWAAVVVGFIGVAVVMRPGAGGHALPPLGLAFGLVAALLTAGVTITLRQLRGTEHVAAIVFWFFVASLVVGGGLMVFVGSVHTPLAFALLAGGGLAGGAAQLLMTASLQKAPVSVVAPFDYLQIVGAVAFGWGLMSAPPTLSTLVGAALIAGGGLYTAWREHVRRRRPSLVQGTPPLS